MVKKIWVLTVLLIFVSCKNNHQTETKQVGVVSESVKPKVKYYTVLIDGKSYTGLRLYGQFPYGDVFIRTNGKSITFRGTYLYYEE